jgi:hypothetical protein
MSYLFKVKDCSLQLALFSTQQAVAMSYYAKLKISIVGRNSQCQIFFTC